MSDILGIGLGVAGTAVNQGIGMMNQGQQVKNQAGLMEHGANLAYRNWLRTNYSAQREQLEKAGMNVGLMYSQGGQAGQLNGGSSGSASAAPTFDVASAISQARALESQVKLNEAQAEKLKVETNKIGGVDTELTQTQVDMNKISNNFNSENFDTALEKSKSELNNINANTEKAVADGKLSKIDGLTRAWENTSNVLNTIASTEKLNADVKQGWQKIAQGWKDLELKTRGLDIEETKVKINEFQAETQRNYPSLMQSAGGVMNDGLKAIYMLLGFDKENQPTTSKVN